MYPLSSGAKLTVRASLYRLLQKLAGPIWLRDRFSDSNPRVEKWGPLDVGCRSLKGEGTLCPELTCRLLSMEPRALGTLL